MFSILQTLGGSQEPFPKAKKYLSKGTLFHSKILEVYGVFLFSGLNINPINNSNPHRHFEYHNISCIKKV